MDLLPYMPVAVVALLCAWTHHGPAPAIVCGFVIGVTTTALKLLPRGSVWRSPSGIISVRQAPPAWAISTRWFGRLLYLTTCAYCGWWAAQ